MYPSSSDEVVKWKRYTIVVAVAFIIIGLLIGGLIGYNIGYNYGYNIGYQIEFSPTKQLYTASETFKENINNLVLAFGYRSWALDTAKSTAYLLDAHDSIYSLVGDRPPGSIKDTIQARQRYFADKTVSLLDDAYERVSMIQNR